MLKLIALGDINIGKDKQVIQSIKYNDSLKKSFQEADVIFANLEGPVTNAGNEPINGDFGLYSEFGAIKFLKEYNVNLVSLANNHMSDYGPLSVEFTTDFLKENDIVCFGWGNNINDVLTPKIFNVKGIKIGLIAITLHDGRNADTSIPGMVPPEERFLIPLIEKTKKQSDFLICSLHWGKEMYPYPDPNDRVFAHKLVDLGIDLILGHHPHVVQGYEVYNNKYIFYSLGNFVFKSFWYKGIKQLQKEESKRTMFLTLDIEDNSVRSFRVTPIRYNEDLTIDLLEGSEKNEFENHFKNISEVLLSSSYNSVYRKFRIGYEFPVKKKIKELISEKGIGLSLFQRLIKFIGKFFKIVVFRR